VKIKDLIIEAEALPMEERAIVADSLLRSLNHPDAEFDKKWAKVAHLRQQEVREGRVETIPGEKVFENLWKIYNQ